MLDRRAFLGVLGLLVAAPAAEAQPAGKQYRIGILIVGKPEQAEQVRTLYSNRLNELGWTEGRSRNLNIEVRYATAVDQTAELARRLVAAKPDVLIGLGPYPAHSLKDATQTIPIVLAAIADPVGRGLVASLARPGGNITGVSHYVGTGFRGKEFQVLMDLLPEARRFAFLRNPANPIFKTFPQRERFDVMQREAGITIDIVEARTAEEIPSAIEAATHLGAKGLIVAADSVFAAEDRTIVDLVAKHRLPAVYPGRGSVLAGGLASYGTDFVAVFRRSADYVDRIFRGAKPGDLPIEQPTKFELVINLKTAKALGLTIPPSLLQRADQVLE